MKSEHATVKILNDLNYIENVLKLEPIETVEREIASTERTIMIMKKNRTAAISSTIERNPNAFRPKIAAAKQVAPSPLSLQGTPHRVAVGSTIPRHSKGCACK